MGFCKLSRIRKFFFCGSLRVVFACRSFVLGVVFMVVVVIGEDRSVVVVSICLVDMGCVVGRFGFSGVFVYFFWVLG